MIFSRRRAAAVLLGAALMLALILTAQARAITFPPMKSTPGQTVVSIEFDDGAADQYLARPILAAHNMKATFFINSAVDLNSYHMTWSQIHDLYSDGNEIGGHTLDHPHLVTLSADEAAREICNDRVNLLSQGFPATDFAYPYGDEGSAVRAQVQQCGYNSGRWIKGIFSPVCDEEPVCPFAESIPPAEPYKTRTPQNVLVTDSLANVERYVTQAQQHGGGWVQLVFHHICNQCDTYSTTEANFTTLLDWLATQQNTTTATVQQVIGGSVQPAVNGPAPVNLPGPDLLHNPSLEADVNGDSVPDGWEAASFGTNTVTWARTTDAHSGTSAERLDMSNFQGGAARLLSRQDQGEYAPTPTVGDNYDVGSYYKSTAPVLFYIYIRNQMGEWRWWTNSGLLPASSGWRKATFTTAPIPAGTTGISVGLGIQQAGSVTVDDLALVDRGVIPPPTNALANPGLESLLANGAGPGCWSRGQYGGAGGGGLTGSWSDTIDVHGGGNAERASVTAFNEGDMKLISQQDATLTNPTLSSATASTSGGSLQAGTYYYEITATTAYGETLPSNQVNASTTGSTGSIALKWPAVASASVTGYRIYRASASGQETLLTSAGSTATTFTDTGLATGSTHPPASNTASKVAPCAPTAIPGDTYQGSAWYKSSAEASVRLVIYYRDATGSWVFWKSQPVPASTEWTQAVLLTEALPPGATALSFGVSLYSVGTLTADDLSLGDATAASASDPPPCGADVCDTVAPSSSASSPAYNTSGSLAISYAAAENPGGSGLARVDLYAKGPGDLGYALVASNPGSATSGVFAYAGLEGDGPYSFYTVASDNAGNSEAAPLSAETTTVLDTTPPSSSATATSYSGSTSLTVSYTAADNPAGSGLAHVDLYARAPGQSTYTKVASDTSGSTTSSFSYTAAAGDGGYSFYTVASDNAGNAETAPGSPDTTTMLDRAAPSSKASAPAVSGSTSITVGYTASDGGSGLERVELYAKAPGQSTYTKVATDSSGSSSGSFTYTAEAGDGSYSFYTLATDNAGNTESAPGPADASTLLDTTAASSKASAPVRSGSTSITVGYSASDGGSGLAHVDLYARGPGDAGYTLVASNTGAASSGAFTYAALKGDGNYSFYTLASDSAGNTQAAPGSADAITLLDTTAPTSKASAPVLSGSASITVSYTASDGGSGLARVELYAKAPGQSTYTKVATDSSPASPGSFNYSAPAGDGSYSFYALASDNAGNTQAAPGSADAITLLDTTAPTSKASAPVLSGSASVTVSYTASDGGSGLERVELYAKAPGQSTYTKVATDSSPGSTGSFSYTAEAGDGSYGFYTLASDNAGNTQAAPSSAHATTLISTTAPSSKASAPALSGSTSITVGYTASDGGSGLQRVELYAKAPGQSTYTKVATDLSGAGTGSFSYTAEAGDGSYGFYTLATDNAGNTQAAPGSADANTLLDTTAPASKAHSPVLSGSAAINVGYTASDGGSGLAHIDLYAKAPGDSTYTKVATDSSGAATGSFSYTAEGGNGSYSFYTLATDNAGNTQSAPVTPDATTLVSVTEPSSKASAPASSASTSITVGYTASDGGSGLERVELYARAPGQSTYTKVATDASGAGTGSFSYTAEGGDGSYSFYTLATDNVGNAESAPGSADAGTLLDTTAPSSKASA
ncbi:MAG: polysaccharide deacetylase, partial [Solirubrobacterales bacterium]|nr:polysaccharide deacetylase [Solirubrobacterales bacterium]